MILEAILVLSTFKDIKKSGFFSVLNLMRQKKKPFDGR